jgi:hypothetical protein
MRPGPERAYTSETATPVSDEQALMDIEEVRQWLR